MGQLDNDSKEVKQSITDLKKSELAKPAEVADVKPKPNERVLLKSLNSQSNIELDENVQIRLKQITDEMKEQHHISIENEEQIQLINKRLSTLEGGSAGVLGFLERVDEVFNDDYDVMTDHKNQVDKNIRKELKDRIGAIEKSTEKLSKEHRKTDKATEELRSKVKNIKHDLERKITDAEDEILAELEKVKLLAETANTQTEMQGSLEMPQLKPEANSPPQFSSSPQDAFKIRNQIQDMWKTLRLDIAHRTGFVNDLFSKFLTYVDKSYQRRISTCITCNKL